MKKIILTLSTTILLTTSVLAQMPNSSFETWTNMGTYSVPDKWDNLNGMTTSAGIYTCTKGTPGSVGTAYLKLVSKTVTGMAVMPGVAVSGMMDMVTFKPVSGFPLAQRPQSLNGSWQHMASGADAGFVSVYLTKWDSVMMMRDTIATAKQALGGMVMSWATFSIPLTYKSNATPDSAVIVLSASGATPVAGSYLYVDNLTLVGNVTGLTAINTNVISVVVYPNPTTDKITVVLSTLKSAIVKLQLVDMAGKIVTEDNVGKIQGNYMHTLPTSHLTKGNYLLKITTDACIETKKIVIK